MNAEMIGEHELCRPAVALLVRHRDFINRVNRLRREYQDNPSYWAPYWLKQLSPEDRSLFESLDFTGVPWNEEDEGHRHKIERWIDWGWLNA